MPRRPQLGQAAVESAIAMPMSVFLILGLLQMGMLQQGRLFADYAAYRGARATSLEMGSCDAVLNAELAALTPVIGRADDLTHWKTTFGSAKAQQRGLYPLVINFWDIDDIPPTQSFDQPVESERDVSRVHLRLYYLYQLQIPFVNWILGRLYLAQYYAAAALPAGSADPIMPVARTRATSHSAPNGPEAAFVEQWAENYFRSGKYVIPLYASWTLRMFSRADPSRNVVSARNPCR